jgi:hypothetical protein
MNSKSELEKLAEIPTLMNEEWELSKAMDDSLIIDTHRIGSSEYAEDLTQLDDDLIE